MELTSRKRTLQKLSLKRMKFIMKSRLICIFYHYFLELIMALQTMTSAISKAFLIFWCGNVFHAFSDVHF